MSGHKPSPRIPLVAGPSTETPPTGTVVPTLEPHDPLCRRVRDPFGQLWHTAGCETPQANYDYARRYGNHAYAEALVTFLFIA